MPSPTATTNAQQSPERRPFYPGQGNNFRVLLRQGKVYLTRHGQELGRVAGILLDRGHTHETQLLLTPIFDTQGQDFSAAEAVEMLAWQTLSPVGGRSGPQNQVQQHARNNLRVNPLTQREKEVLRLIEVGLSTREIAAELIISTSTVKRHIATIFGKLGANRRTQAVAVARNLAIL